MGRRGEVSGSDIGLTPGSGVRPMSDPRSVVLALCIVCSLISCGGGGAGAPTQPPPPTPVTPPTPPPASTATLRGAVIESLTGNRIPRATLTLTTGAGVTTTVAANDAGDWEFTPSGALSTSVPVSVSAPGYVTRTTQLRWLAAGRADVTIDLIRDADPFSLPYYRQLVRNLFEAPEAPPEPIRRWLQAPNFYIDTRNPQTGGVIPQHEIDRLVLLIREAVPQLSGGRLNAGEFVMEPAERAPRVGYINISFIHEPDGEACGYAFVGANPGAIEINYGARDLCGSRCGPFAWSTVTHEVGHAMGFWHVDEGFIMSTVWYDSDCDKTTLSPVERHHAAVAYARPRGNQDPDVDPDTTLLLQPERSPVRLSCR